MKHTTPQSTVHPLAMVAIRAAKHRSSWGVYAARKYCLNKGVPLSLYRLACQLDAIAKTNRVDSYLQSIKYCTGLKP